MTDRQLDVVLPVDDAALAWAYSYYLPAILADPIARDLGISGIWFFAGFSGSLVISGLLGRGPADRPRRQVLRASNVILAAGLALLGASTLLWMMSAAWLLLGVGMGLGLYDAAFGALGRTYGDNVYSGLQHRRPDAQLARPGNGRMAGNALRVAAAHILIGLSLNLFFLPRTAPAQRTAGPVVKAFITARANEK